MNIVLFLCGFLCVSAQRSQLKAALKDQYWKSWEHKTRQGELEWLAAAESKFGQEPARPGGWSGSTSVYVDGRNGADSNDGSFGHPLKTLTAARDMVRKWPSLPTGGIEIVLRGGEYTFQDSPFTLDGPQDSGTAASPITYTAYESENVVLSAGQSLPGITDPAWKPAEDLGDNIRQIDLTPYGIPSWGDLAPGSLGTCANNKLELFFDEKAMILARYPNINSEGVWEFDQIQGVVAGGFNYNGSRPQEKKWADANDLWMHGYWQFDWADSYVKVDSIDTHKQIFYIDPKTPPCYNFTTKARYYAVNLLQELDAPGEYYLDRKSGTLYFYPPSLSASASIAVSVGQAVVNVNNASFVQFKNLKLAYARQQGIAVTASSHITVENCDASNNGAVGISVATSSACRVAGSTVLNSGCQGISVSGGDRKSLQAANTVVSGNTVSGFARWKRTYNAGIAFSGVGINITSNIVSNGPHTGMTGGGNDLLFDNNTFRHLAYEVDDSGGLYVGRSWSQRGNVASNNLFEHVRTTQPTYLGAPAVQGLYLDDEMSGWTVAHNTFNDCQTGIMLGGGRRNLIVNNRFSQCDLCVEFDDRGLSWQKAYCSPGGHFQQDLESFNYQQPPYSVRYPEIVNIFKEQPCTPVFNLLSGNRYTNSCKTFVNQSPETIKTWNSTATNNSRV